MNNLFEVFLYSVYKYSLRIFVSLFIRDIELCFFFKKGSLYHGNRFVIKLGNAPSASILLNNLRCIGTSYSLKAWWNPAMNPSNPGLCWAEKFLFTVSISLDGMGVCLYCSSNLDLNLIGCI